MKALAYFRVRQANNGWILNISSDMARPYGEGQVGEEYVFPTLDAMNEWLKEKYEPA